MLVQLICSSQEVFSSLQNIVSPYLLNFATFCEPKINKDVINQFCKLGSEGYQTRILSEQKSHSYLLFVIL